MLDHTMVILEDPQDRVPAQLQSVEEAAELLVSGCQGFDQGIVDQKRVEQQRDID